jgi:phage shock protein A
MSLWSRVLLIIRAKGQAALERVEDPREVLGYVDEQQQELLRRVKQGLIEVAISKRQLQQQVEKLDTRVPRLEDQARRAIAAGRQDLARLALERKQRALAEMSTLQTHVAEVDQEERRLTLAEQQLVARIEEFRMHRQTLAARYTAAEAQVQVNEALGGVSQDFADLGMALGRAEERIERMQAHASAVGALVDSGVLAMPTVEGDIVERELLEVAGQQGVEEELAALEAELNPGKALGSGESDD